jgi:hypothetical protein
VRRAEPVAATRGQWFKDALLHSNNPSLCEDETGRLVLQQAGTSIDIGCSKEQVQLHFRLSCGVHYRLCTPHSVTGASRLRCLFCSPPLVPRKGAPKGPTDLERTMHAGLVGAGLGPALRAEYRPSWWGGCIDFMHHPTGVLIQVDGPYHFASTLHGTPPARQQGRDLNMNSAAWEHGRILLRAHHADVESGMATTIATNLIQLASTGLQGPCVVLTPSCVPHGALGAHAPDEVHAWLNALLLHLPGACARIDSKGCMWLAPSTPV